jgi:hypothetical protein
MSLTVSTKLFLSFVLEPKNVAASAFVVDACSYFPINLIIFAIWSYLTMSLTLKVSCGSILHLPVVQMRVVLASLIFQYCLTLLSSFFSHSSFQFCFHRSSAHKQYHHQQISFSPFYLIDNFVKNRNQQNFTVGVSSLKCETGWRITLQWNFYEDHHVGRQLSCDTPTSWKGPIWWCLCSPFVVLLHNQWDISILSIISITSMQL